MKNSKSKFLTIVFLITFILTFILSGIKITKAQFAVPVFDSGANSILANIVNSLNNLNLIAADEFMKLNNRITSILQTAVESSMDKNYLDFTKNHKLAEYYLEINGLIEERKRKKEEEFDKDMDEATLAGVFSAFDKIPFLISCLDVEVKDELMSYLEQTDTFFTDPRTSISYQEAILSIPECDFEYSNNLLTFNQTIKSKEKNKEGFLAKFFKIFTNPFNLGLLAQVNPPSNLPSFDSIDSNSQFVISPAFKESERSLQFIYAQDRIKSIIKNEINFAKETRKNQIGEVKPIEKCVRQITIDNGHLICTKYEPIVDANDLLKAKENIERSLFQSAQNLSPGQKLSEVAYFQDQRALAYNLQAQRALAYNLLLSTGIINQGIVNPALFQQSFEELMKLSKINCEKFLPKDQNTGEPASASKTPDAIFTSEGYIKCMEEMGKNIQRVAEEQKKEAEQTEKTVSSTIDIIAKTKDEINQIRLMLNNLGDCSNIKEELENIEKILGDKETRYKQAQTLLAKINYQIKINDSLIKNKILAFGKDVLPYVQKYREEAEAKFDEVLNELTDKIRREINRLITRYLPQEIATLFTEDTKVNKYKDIITPLKNKIIDMASSTKLDLKLGEFGSISIKLSEIIATTAQAYFDLKNNQNINKSIIFADITEITQLNNIINYYKDKLQGENPLELCKKNQGNPPIGTSLRKINKNIIISKNQNYKKDNLNKPIIIVEKDKKQGIKIPFSFNLSKIFSWRYVEVNFKK